MHTAIVSHVFNGGLFRVSVVASTAERFSINVEPHATRLDLEAPGLALAAESASLSGAAYAIRLFGLGPTRILIVEVVGNCRPGEVEGFAIAAGVAIAMEVGCQERIADLLAADWVIVQGNHRVSGITEDRN